MEVSEFLRNPQLSTSDNNIVATGESFVIDDLLDFPSDDEPIPVDVLGSSFHSLPADSTNSSSATAVITSSASHSNVSAAANLSGDLCVPVPDDDDMAELEWLSNVGEESFSSEDLEKLQLISGIIKVEPSETTDHSIVVNNNNSSSSSQILNSDVVSVPAKARSKRPRVTPCNWATRLLHLGKKRRKEMGGEGEDRRCVHCATNTTPQWRTGPMGPKTLCNACGVRYKSGRLVPEYRPAASPTFVLTKHSNSHRKVMELRRQKEMMHHHHPQFLHHHPNFMMFDFHVSNHSDDYLIHQHLDLAHGHDFRQQLI